jgi:hypothetical protein
MSYAVSPYRTERENNDLAVTMTLALGVVGGLVKLSTGYAFASALSGMAAAYVVLQVSNQLAMRRGAELLTEAEAAKRQAIERAAMPIWSLCLRLAVHNGNALIILNMLAWQPSDFRFGPFVFVILASPLLGAVVGLSLGLRARWRVRQMARAG